MLIRVITKLPNYTLHVGIHILIFFLAHRAKGNVGFWHPSFVVCHLLTFHILIFSSETQQPNELKLSRKHLKSAHFVMIHLYQTWPSTGNSCFWLANFFKSPPLKPLGQINRNMAGSIYGMSSIKIAHFVSID